MRTEYETIVNSGLILSVDCPDLAMGRHIKFRGVDDDEFLRNAEMQVEALNHALANLPFVRLQQLKGEAFILTSRENAPSYRSWLARLCQRAGFSPKVVQEVDRARTAVQYVAAGFGISIFGEHICRQPAPGVKFIPLRPGGQKIRYGVAWRKQPVEPLVLRFIEYTKEQLGSSDRGEKVIKP